MKNPLGLVLIALGVVLLVYGINSSNSVGSDVKKAITGTPTDRSMWLIIGGVVAAAGGLGVLVLRGSPPENR
jgi:hypothetical protein